ncbi:MAG TPA: DUF5005 domain-containing protein [Candidatus Dormibacteraeota bacterium]|nr:DUF5005 domain-containing protein [Candidatus Dormibacteraeota bacterium]
MTFSATLRIAFLFSALFPVAVFGQCTLPANPSTGTPDSTFDAYVTQNGPGWTGADGTYSVPLPDGTNLWIWSDSYIGTVDPTTRLRKSDIFTAHNSMTILNQATGSWSTVGYPPKTSSYFVPTNRKDWFWVGDAVVVQPTAGTYQIKVMLMEWTGAFKLVGHSLATLSWPGLAITSITPITGLDTSLIWGTKILQVGNFFYIYGLKDPGTNTKTPYIARMTSLNNLTNASKWQFWNAIQSKWLTGEANATAMSGVAAVTPEYSVDQMSYNGGRFYLMAGMDPQNPPFPLWNALTTWYSCSPQGPWSNKTTVYTAPEAGANGCKTGTLVTYNAKAHSEFTDANGILMSYNVNANDGSDLVCADDYKPRFVRVPIPGVTD